jgi:putative GTP pyrophosphokinase
MTADDPSAAWWHRREALRDQYDAVYQELRATLAELVAEIEGRLVADGLRATVRGRVKRFDAFYRKVLERSRSVRFVAPFEYITDVVGLRVVTPFVDDLQQVAAVLRAHYALEEVDDKALALSVGEFGYDATHLLVAIPEALRERHPQAAVRVVEVQLRTTLQDAWAEVEHELVYKADLDVVDVGIRRKLMALNATLSLADTIFQEIRDYQRRRYTELRARHQELMDKVSTIPEKAGLKRGGPPRAWPEEAAAVAADAPGVSAEVDMSDVLVRALAAHLDADLPEAIALYSQVLAVRPVAAVLNHRGIAYFALSHYEHAIADFTAAIAMAPKEPHAFTNRGLARRMAGDLQGALADLDHSLGLNPMWADTLYGRALTHFDLGNIPAALRDCDRAIALKPEFKQVLRFKQFIQDADL